VETILVAAEASWIRDQVQVAFVEPGQRVVEVQRGQDVRDAVSEYEPSVVILDMQIGNMGGIAVALDIRLEQGEGRMPETQILLLLDREADKFLAGRSDVDGVLVKPIDAGRLRRAVKNLLPSRVATVAAAAAAGSEPILPPWEETSAPFEAEPDAVDPVDLAPEA
jgi:DNA-binding response OmpR family regulator